jgi:hypothetical protein
MVIDLGYITLTGRVEAKELGPFLLGVQRRSQVALLQRLAVDAVESGAAHCHERITPWLRLCGNRLVGALDVLLYLPA